MFCQQSHLVREYFDVLRQPLQYSEQFPVGIRSRGRHGGGDIDGFLLGYRAGIIPSDPACVNYWESVGNSVQRKVHAIGWS